MKNLLLLLFASLAFYSSIAQESQKKNSRPLGQRVKTQAHPTDKQYHNARIDRSRSAQRTTADTVYAYGGWFDYWGQNTDFSVSGYYFDVYPDSNLIDPATISATNDGYVFTHGLGMSFDPTDNGYYDGANGIGCPPIVQTTDSSTIYAVDSFLCIGKYIRNDPSSGNVDSIIVDLIATSATGTYLRTYPANVNYTVITSDSTPRVALANYMPCNYAVHPGLANDCWDSISSTYVSSTMQRYAFPLTAASVNDTDADGFNEIFFPLGHYLWVDSGQKVVAYVHFKSQVNYPLGTSTADANYFRLFSGDPGGTTVWPQQPPSNHATGYKGSFQTGIISLNPPDYGSSGYGAHNLLYSPMSLFDPAAPGGPYGFEVPWMSFHVLWEPFGSDSSGGCDRRALNVKDVKNVTEVSAYPNPATDAVEISFNLPGASNVSVTLTNMVGQVVATQRMYGAGSGKANFNTSDLSDGVYVYMVCADGVRITGRVVIAH